MRETDHGRWVHRDADIHRCQRPRYDSSIKVGDRWQCNTCEKVWRVKGVDYGTQWDPSPATIVWEDYEAYKSGPFAPGTK